MVAEVGVAVAVPMTQTDACCSDNRISSRHCIPVSPSSRLDGLTSLFTPRLQLTRCLPLVYHLAVAGYASAFLTRRSVPASHLPSLMSWQHTSHSQQPNPRTPHAHIAPASASPHHTIHHSSHQHSSDPSLHAYEAKHASSAPRPYKPLPPLTTRATSQPAVNRALFTHHPQPPAPPLTHHSSYAQTSLLHPSGLNRSHAYSPPPSRLSPSYSPSLQPLSPSSPPFLASLPPSHSAARRPVPRVLRGMSAIDINGNGGRHQRQSEVGEDDDERERRRRKREGGERWERDRRSWLWGWRCCRLLQSCISSSTTSQSLPLFSPPSTRSKWTLTRLRLLQLVLIVCCLSMIILLAYSFLSTSSPPLFPFDAPLSPTALPFNIPSLSYLPTLPLPLPPPLAVSAVGNRSVLLFAILRDFNEQFAGLHADENNRYQLAITSWLSLATLAASSQSYSVGLVDIVLFVDSAESCAHMADERLAVQCEALSVDERCVYRLPSGSTRPFMHCVWESVAARHSSSNGGRYSDYLFVNGDILLFPSLLSALSLVHRTYPASNASYSLVIRRRDKSFAGLTTAALSPEQLADTEQSFTTDSVLHDSFGIDVFLLSAAVFPAIVDRFPAFLIGVYRWDNWLLAELLRPSSVWSPVVDGSEVVVVGHDSLLSDHLNDAGREWNDNIAKRLLGQAYRTGNTDNADVRIVSTRAPGSADATVNGASWRLQLNVDERMQLHSFRHARLNTLALVPGSSADLQPTREVQGGMLSRLLSSPPSLPALSVLQMFLCTAQRLNFTEYVLVAEDAAVYWTLLSQRYNNVVLNVNRSLILAAPPLPSTAASSASSLSLLSFNSTSYPQLFSSLLFLSHLTKQLLSYPTHTLLLHPSTALLSHPFHHLNLSCDLHASASLLSPSFMLLTSYPPPHHSYPAWLMRKVDECVVREVEDVVDERRKRHRRALRGPLGGRGGPDSGMGDQREAETEESTTWDRYSVMGAVGRQCLQEMVTFQLQALPSFVQCRDSRVKTWTDMEVERAERSKAAEARAAALKGEDKEEEEEDDHVRALPPWPFAVMIADEAETSSASHSKALVLHSLSTQCVSAPPTQQSRSHLGTAGHAVSHEPIFLHVHVRGDASEQSIRLFLRSLVLADYTSLPAASPQSPPLLLASFDLTALPYSHPPSPLHLSSRISAIIDEYEQDVDGLRVTLHSRLQAAELTKAASDDGSKHGELFSFSHEGEMYVSTRLIQTGGSGDGYHLFVDNGMLMPRLWYQHFLSSLAHSHVDGLMGMALYSLPLPAALSTASGGSGASQSVYYSPFIPLSHSLLGMLLHASSLLSFHHFLATQPDEVCDSDARTMEKVAMHDGLFLQYMTDVTRTRRRAADGQVETDEERIGMVDVRLGAVSGREALRLEYQLWRGSRHDHCEW